MNCKQSVGTKWFNATIDNNYNNESSNKTKQIATIFYNYYNYNLRIVVGSISENILSNWSGTGIDVLLVNPLNSIMSIRNNEVGVCGKLQLSEAINNLSEVRIDSPLDI